MSHHKSLVSFSSNFRLKSFSTLILIQTISEMLVIWLLLLHYDWVDYLQLNTPLGRIEEEQIWKKKFIYSHKLAVCGSQAKSYANTSLYSAIYLY